MVVGPLLGSLLGSRALLAASLSPSDGTDRATEPAVVFVPGVSGSRLEDPSTGRVIWGDGPLFIAPKDRGHSTVLPLSVGVAPDDGIEATAVLSHIELLAFKREIYRPLMRYLEEAGYQTGDLEHPRAQDDLYFFAYDWRRPNQDTVETLHQALTEIAEQRGDVRIRLVCQSNAGRVCRWLAKYGDTPPGALAPESPRASARVQALSPLSSPLYKIEQLVLVSNSHGGALRQLHELHNGRRYVPIIGRTMGPESLFAVRPLIEDLPFHRRDLFVDESGTKVDIDLFDALNWQRYQWSVFAPQVEEILSQPGLARLFGTEQLRFEYLQELLSVAQQANELLMQDSPFFDSTLCLLQNVTEPTIDRAVLVQDPRTKAWHTLFAGDGGLPRSAGLRSLLEAPGDGHGTAASQEFLSTQEERAVTGRFRVTGGHFDTITTGPTLDAIQSCLDQPSLESSRRP